MENIKKVTEKRTLRSMVKIIVHAGVFHMDDVLCAAMAKYVNPNIVVERSFARTFDDSDDMIVADVGGGEFDHHQEDAALRPDGHKHSACGLMFEAFWRELYGSELFYESFREKYIIPIEDADNGIIDNPLSCFVATMNPAWDSEESSDDAFCQSRGICNGADHTGNQSLQI